MFRFPQPVPHHAAGFPRQVRQNFVHADQMT
jgi:hypothetical protein